MSKQARPKRSLTSTLPVMIGGVELLGRKPKILARIKTGSREMRDTWDFTCRRNGLVAVLLQDYGHNAYYEVIGTVPGLTQLINSKCCMHWEFELVKQIARQGTGCTPKQ